jgi:hypothetical protein
MSKLANNEIQANSLADNKIQAKTPEVGDVFQSKEDTDIKLYITGKNNVGFEALVSNSAEIWDIDSWYFDEDYYTYLGKSKVNIEDLFKTENK